MSSSKELSEEQSAETEVDAGDDSSKYLNPFPLLFVPSKQAQYISKRLSQKNRQTLIGMSKIKATGDKDNSQPRNNSQSSDDD